MNLSTIQIYTVTVCSSLGRYITPMIPLDPFGLDRPETEHDDTVRIPCACADASRIGWVMLGVCFANLSLIRRKLVFWEVERQDKKEHAGKVRGGL